MTGTKIGVFQPGVGAPLAAALMEEVIVRDVEKSSLVVDQGSWIEISVSAIF